MTIGSSGSRIVIIADDLTGALDSAAPFAARGLETRVVLDEGQFPDRWPDGLRILSVSTNSREEHLPDAVAAVRRTAERLARLDPTLVFKKVDSRLKGHVAAEIQVCLDVFGLDRALVAPAIPAFGRVTRDGLLSGSGIEQPIDVAERSGAGYAIPDIVDEADFARSVRIILAGGTLAVGARGLAQAIAGQMSSGARTLPPLLRPMLFAIGSVDPITRAQLRALESGLEADKGASRQVKLLASPELDGAIDTKKAAAFARTVMAHLRDDPPETLLVTGGETARHVLRQLDVFELIVQGEILPGIPQTIAQVDGRQVTVLTKSGGFGDSATLVSLLKRTEVGHDAYV